MDFHYDLSGCKDPIQRDVPMYDAATVALGELLMLGNTDPDSNADGGSAFQTAYEGTQSQQAVDALGICMEAETPTTASPSGFEYYKAVVNPFAVYMAEYSQATSDDVAITTAGSASTTVTITSIEDDIDDGWLYFPLASGGAQYMLRYITADTTNALTVSQAITTATSDTVIKILPVNHRLINLTADAIKLISQAAAGTGESLHIVDNLIVSARHSLQSMRYGNLQLITEALPSDTKIYADLVMLDHVYNNA